MAVNSRKIEDLAPSVQEKARAFIAACAIEGIDLLVTSTFRDNEAQAALFAQGRTKPGNVVTNARPGQSWHNWRCALDVVPLRSGKPVWDTRNPVDAALWRRVGELGESVGLQWAGRWKGPLLEMAHFQDSQGKTLAQLQAGATLA